MGASNLNIRFNLPVIPPASFAIEKELPENVQADYTDRRFAFKVYVQEEYNSSNYVQIDPDMWDRVDINHVPATMVIDGTGTVSSDSQSVSQRAQFTLKKLDPEGYGTYPADPDKVEKVSEYTGEDGKTYIGGIKNGYYEISETAVPAGYVLIDDGKFYIKVQNGNITLLAKDTNKKVKDWPERTLTDQDKLQFDNKTNTFTVGNPPGVALPSAGGSGTILIYLLGGLLCASAAIALDVRRHMLKI